MDSRRVAETPLITGTDLLTHAALGHAVSAHSVGAALALLIGLLVAIIVAPIAADLRRRLGTGSPDAATACLRAAAHTIAWALVPIVTLVSEALSVDASTIWTIRIKPTGVHVDLAGTIDQDLAWRTRTAVGEKHDAASHGTAVVRRALAREGTLT